MQPNSRSIIRRWVCGSLLITVLVLVLAEGLFLYYSYKYCGQNLPKRRGGCAL